MRNRLLFLLICFVFYNGFSQKEYFEYWSYCRIPEQFPPAHIVRQNKIMEVTERSCRTNYKGNPDSCRLIKVSAFDKDGGIISESYAGGKDSTKVFYMYNAKGRLIRDTTIRCFIPAENYGSAYFYDKRGRLTKMRSVTRTDTFVTEFSKKGDTIIISVSKPHGYPEYRRTVFFDSASNTTRVKVREAFREEYLYSETKSDRKKKTTIFYSRRGYDRSSTTYYEYDQRGLIIQASDEYSRTFYKYRFY